MYNFGGQREHLGKGNLINRRGIGGTILKKGNKSPKYVKMYNTDTYINSTDTV